MSDELKPCPFCGDKAVYSHISTGPIKGYCSIGCGSCDVSVVNVSKDAAIFRWQRRTDPTDTQRLIDEAVAAENKACAKIAITAGVHCQESSIASEGDDRYPYDFAHTVTVGIVNNILARTNPPADDHEPDLSKCPCCGGDADNGHDRALPPSPYYCRKCQTEADDQGGV